ncbi:MAG TPA: hypothetical protein VFH83_04300 [Spirochaetia bacterium]|nr:hypothetical protein [Spirochaetia bacterium]
MSRSPRSRTAIRVLLVVAACAGVLAGCASLQRSVDQGDVREVTDLINSGQAAKLSAMSATPFLLDGEIVALRSDVAALWDNVVKAGFRLSDAGLARSVAVAADSYREFAGTLEVKAFFDSQVKPGTRILELRTAEGTRVLLLLRDAWFKRTLIGFKGPY